MKVITKKINKILASKDVSRYKLSQMINYDDSAINAMILSKRSFPESVVEKLLPILEVSREEFESWIIADKYSKEVLELAIKAKKAHCHCEGFSPKQSKKAISTERILTIKIDSILQEKSMSRTDLSKQIKYSQSGLNSIIIGKRGMSKSVLEKLSIALDISQNEILSWIVADKYSLKTLKKAYN